MRGGGKSILNRTSKAKNKTKILIFLIKPENFQRSVNRPTKPGTDEQAGSEGCPSRRASQEEKPPRTCMTGTFSPVAAWTLLNASCGLRGPGTVQALRTLGSSEPRVPLAATRVEIPVPPHAMGRTEAAPTSHARPFPRTSPLPAGVPGRRGAPLPHPASAQPQSAQCPLCSADRREGRVSRRGPGGRGVPTRPGGPRDGVGREQGP